MNAYDKFQNDPSQYDMGGSDASEGSMGDSVSNMANVMAKRYSKSGGGSSGSVGKDVGSMMMMSGDPTTMAAGATLGVISGVADRRRQERQAKADAENDRRTKLMAALGNLGQGIGSVGMA